MRPQRVSGTSRKKAVKAKRLERDRFSDNPNFAVPSASHIAEHLASIFPSLKPGLLKQWLAIERSPHLSAKERGLALHKLFEEKRFSFKTMGERKAFKAIKNSVGREVLEIYKGNISRLRRRNP